MKKRNPNKKGISPLIATVLIIGFTVALGAVVMIWGSGFVKTMQETSEQSMEVSQSCAAAMVGVDNIQPESANRISFMMENVGQTKIDSVIVRITGTDGVDSVTIKKGLNVAAKSLFSAKFNPEKVGLVTKIDIIPNLEINAKQTPCAPGIEFSVDEPSQSVVDQWEAAYGDEVINPEIEDCDNTADPMFPSKPGGGIWDCKYLGFDGGNLICTDSGTIDVSECEGDTTCGNNQLDPEAGDPTEGCDYVNDVATYVAGITDCISLDAAIGGEYGFTKGSLSCDADCMIDTSQCTATGVVEETGPTVIEIAAGSAYTCALMQNGDTYCWGYNGNGQLGDGTTTQKNIPTKTLMTAATQIAAGEDHTCATNSSGMYCWGIGSFGQLGDGTTITIKPTPTKTLMTDPIKIAIGSLHTCATNSSGMYCWGYGSYGQLGYGAIGQLTSPMIKVQMTNPTKITAGGYHTCATNTLGMYCWGIGSFGQLGDGTVVQKLIPVLNTMTNPTKITAGGYHTCATNTLGMYCWGSNSNGQIGNNGVGGLVNSPTLNQMTNPTTIAAGKLHTCATNTLGMYCWGSNSYGQIGDETIIQKLIPTLNQMTNPTTIAAGEFHTCATNSSGMYCWGIGSFGQLGNGETTQRTTPTKVEFS
ncbi:MAG: archaellin/type IV pilin N-terminal domain-containing protein [archaeon]